MPCKTIVKPRRNLRLGPNLADYEQACAEFSWSKARLELDGLLNCGGLNIAHEAVDRHVAGPLANHLAIRWLGKTGKIRDYTIAELLQLSNRFANTLQRLGVTKGESVFALAGRIPELYITAFGTLKNRSVFCPLFSAFGPEPIRSRMTIGQARVLLTTVSLYERKIATIRESLPNLKHIILVGNNETSAGDTLDFHRLMDESSPEFTVGPTDPGDPALLHFTSGTTGTPKEAVHVHEAVVAHHITGKLALDLHSDDIFWCTADPGWVTGTSYGIIAPLTNGQRGVDCKCRG